LGHNQSVTKVKIQLKQKIIDGLARFYQERDIISHIDPDLPNFHVIDNYVELELLYKESENRCIGITREEQLDVNSNHKKSFDWLTLFDSGSPKKYIICSPPGAGKSVLMHHIATRFISSKSSEAQKSTEFNHWPFDWVILLHCRDFYKLDKNHLESTFPLYKIINLLCLKNLSGLEQHSNQKELHELLLSIIDNSKKTLLLLDGLDELPERRAVNYLKNRLLHHFSYHIISSRPHAVAGYFQSNQYQLIEINGFSAVSQQNYLINYTKKKGISATGCDIMLNLLKAQSDLPTHLPVILDAFCYLTAHKIYSTESSSKNIHASHQSHWYNEIVGKLVERFYFQRQEMSFSHTSNHAFYSSISDTHLMRFLIALVDRQQLNPIITEETLFEVIDSLINKDEKKQLNEATKFTLKDKNSLLGDKGLINCGLLTKGQSNSSNYQFLHLSFQEFLLAKHFADGIKTKQSWVIDTARHYKYSPKYQQIWRFTSGLLDINDIECMLSLFLCEPRNKAFCYPDVNLIFNVLENVPLSPNNDTISIDLNARNLLKEIRSRVDNYIEACFVILGQYIQNNNDKKHYLKTIICSEYLSKYPNIFFHFSTKFSQLFNCDSQSSTINMILIYLEMLHFTQLPTKILNNLVDLLIKNRSDLFINRQKLLNILCHLDTIPKNFFDCIKKLHQPIEFEKFQIRYLEVNQNLSNSPSSIELYQLAFSFIKWYTNSNPSVLFEESTHRTFLELLFSKLMQNFDVNLLNQVLNENDIPDIPKFPELKGHVENILLSVQVLSESRVEYLLKQLNEINDLEGFYHFFKQAFYSISFRHTNLDIIKNELKVIIPEKPEFPEQIRLIGEGVFNCYSNDEVKKNLMDNPQLISHKDIIFILFRAFKVSSIQFQYFLEYLWCDKEEKIKQAKRDLFQENKIFADYIFQRIQRKYNQRFIHCNTSIMLALINIKTIIYYYEDVDLEKTNIEWHFGRYDFSGSISHRIKLNRTTAEYFFDVLNRYISYKKLYPKDEESKLSIQLYQKLEMPTAENINLVQYFPNFSHQSRAGYRKPKKISLSFGEKILETVIPKLSFTEQELALIHEGNKESLNNWHQQQKILEDFLMSNEPPLQAVHGAVAYFKTGFKDNEEINGKIQSFIQAVESKIDKAAEYSSNDKLLSEPLNDLISAQLTSLRHIDQVRLQNGALINCRMVPASPDGDCGFTTIQRCLRLQGHDKFADQISRRGLIDLIEDNLCQNERHKLIQQDGYTSFNLWKDAFQKSGGIWLCGHHFQFLANLFNINFNFYCIDIETNELVPEKSYENIGPLDKSKTKIHLHIAHVSILPINDINAVLNHFEGLCLSPNKRQKQQINGWLDRESGLLLNKTTASTLWDHQFVQKNTHNYRKQTKTLEKNAWPTVVNKFYLGDNATIGSMTYAYGSTFTSNEQLASLPLIQQLKKKEFNMDTQILEKPELNVLVNNPLESPHLVNGEPIDIRLNYHPQDSELAKLASHSYVPSKESAPEGWTVLATASANNGYDGVLYWHAASRHIVIAHRGTEPPASDNQEIAQTQRYWFNAFGRIYDFARTNAVLAQKKLQNLNPTIKDLSTDFFGVAQSGEVSQIESCLDFTQQMLGKLKDVDILSFSVTGHSLGGWLAQLTTYEARLGGLITNQVGKFFDLHCVVFDSPGAKNIIEYHEQRFADDFKTNLQKDLDITTYLSAPNLVNTCNAHVGTLYRIFPDFSDIDTSTLKGWGQYLLHAHTMDHFRQFFTESEAGFPRQLKQVIKWPQVDWTQMAVSELTIVHTLFRYFANHATNLESLLATLAKVDYQQFEVIQPYCRVDNEQVDYAFSNQVTLVRQGHYSIGQLQQDGLVTIPVRAFGLDRQNVLTGLNAYRALVKTGLFDNQEESLTGVNQLKADLESRLGPNNIKILAALVSHSEIEGETTLKLSLNAGEIFNISSDNMNQSEWLRRLQYKAVQVVKQTFAIYPDLSMAIHETYLTLPSDILNKYQTLEEAFKRLEKALENFVKQKAENKSTSLDFIYHIDHTVNVKAGARVDRVEARIANLTNVPTSKLEKAFQHTQIMTDKGMKSTTNTERGSVVGTISSDIANINFASDSPTTSTDTAEPPQSALLEKHGLYSPQPHRRVFIRKIKDFIKSLSNESDEDISEVRTELETLVSRIDVNKLTKEDRDKIREKMLEIEGLQTLIAKTQPS